MTDGETSGPEIGPILVVDDDPEIRALIRDVLLDEGHAVLTAGNGAEALARVAQVRPALVLLDLQMPVMDGLETFARMQVLPTRAPVVFMTAGPLARADAEAYGADGHLAKPFNLDTLSALVAHFCAA